MKTTKWDLIGRILGNDGCMTYEDYLRELCQKGLAKDVPPITALQWDALICHTTNHKLMYSSYTTKHYETIARKTLKTNNTTN